MFSVNDSDLKKYKKNLENSSKYAYPDVVRSTLTKEAYEASEEYKKNVKKELTIRGGASNIVLKSIHYEKTQYGEKDVNKMTSFVGQQSKTFGRKTEQLKKQEFGESLVAKGKHTAKATKFTRLGSFKRFVPKENLVARVNAKKINDLVQNPATGKKEQFKQAVAVAHKSNKTINFLPESDSRLKFGLYRLEGKKKTKAAKLLYSFKEKVQHLHARPMLKPATDKISNKGGEIFVKEAERKLTKEMSKGLKK